jgi:hypothetical protein
MHQNKTTLERAFEIARSGLPRGVEDIRTQLKSEGYDTRQLHGPTLRKQLLQMLKAARTAAESTPN